ncbi:MAG TPA: PD-(D/E)XK nuclease-like domain-containing protein [Gemmatimonadaceae bacterium]|nr:PD-(D/E)XK nuclease-like domain-containing protein [Gemmatimonadaceae bacterium]
MTPGEYPGLPIADYLRLPAVSASLVRTLLERCPRAAWWESPWNPLYEPETSDESDAGIIAHAILFEGRSDVCEVIDPLDHPAEKTGAIPDGWTNKSIRAARDAAREAGKIPVLAAKYELVCAMVDAARTYIGSLCATEPAIWEAFQPGGGDSEVTILWNEAGTLCRMRPDRISHDRRLVVDGKFTLTSAEPDAWGRSQMIRMGYYISAAFYRRGIAAHYGVEDAAYVYLVVEQEPPHLCSLVGVDQHGFALGDDKVRVALAQWAKCARVNVWPGYPARVAYPEIPAWTDAQWQERHASYPMGIPYDVAKLFPSKARV